MLKIFYKNCKKYWPSKNKFYEYLYIDNYKKKIRKSKISKIFKIPKIYSVPVYNIEIIFSKIIKFIVNIYLDINTGFNFKN